MLDIRFILMAVVAITGLNAFIALYMCRRTRVPGTLWWGLGAAMVSLCSLLFGLRGVVHDLLSIVVANGVGMIGYGFIWQGMRLYSGKTFVMRTYIVVAVVAVFAMAESYFFSAIIPSVELRIQIGAFLLFLFSVFTANALLFNSNRTYSVVFAGILFCISALVNALRCVLVVITPEVGSYLISMGSVRAFFMGYLVFFLILTILQIYMVRCWIPVENQHGRGILSS